MQLGGYILMGSIESNALTAKILSTTNNFSEKKIFRRIHLFSQNIRLLQYEADSLKCSTHDIFQTYLRLKDIIGSTAIFKHFRRVQRYKADMFIFNQNQRHLLLEYSTLFSF